MTETLGTSGTVGRQPRGPGGHRDTHRGRGPQVMGLRGRPLAAVLIGWFFVVFDGYDLIVYGTVQGTLMNHWDLTTGQAGTLGSMAFVGMAVGAVVVGRISDRVGRKTAVIGSVVVLSVFTLLCTLAGSAWVFGLLRLVAGIGLGGLVPSVNALVADLAPARFRAAWPTVMMSGVPLGGSAAAVLAQFVVPTHPEYGWRYMFLFAVVPLVVGIPLALRYLPSDRRAGAPTTPDTPTSSSRTPGFSDILRGALAGRSMLFAVATFFTLLAWYGLGTWLPKLMQESGYDFGAALNLTLALNLGAVLGSVVTAWAGDRFGAVRAGVVAALVAGVALLLLLTAPSVGWVYLIMVLAGVGTHGTQILIIAAISGYYPGELRGTALGWALGVGRIGAIAAPQLAGWLLDWGLGVTSSYLLFGGAALLSCTLLLVIWRVVPVPGRDSGHR
jgi:AAHS family benzoate transporter-like MFS transporter